jgi:phospholipid transport system transporter-binding protein
MTRDGDRVTLSGPLNLQTVPAVLRFGLENFLDGARIVDFAGVTEVDSSAVAMAIEWVRAMRQQAAAGAGPAAGLHFVNLPPGFVSLAQLYGLAGLLPVD